MTTKALLQRCAELGIKLALREDDDNRLLVDAPKGVLSASLRNALAAHKRDLIAVLKAQRTSRPSLPHSSAQDPDTGTRKPATTTPSSPEATPLILEHSTTNPTGQSHRTEVEVTKLLSGSEFDESVVNTSDVAARQSVSAQLLAALTGRNADERSRARNAFLTFGFLSEATSELRTADSPAERAAAARKLGVVRDSGGTSQLIESLEDSAPEVRRAAVESLGLVGDPSALPALNALLLRENSRQLPPALIRHAINSIGVHESALPSVSESPAAPVSEPHHVEPLEIRSEKLAGGSRLDAASDYLIALEQRSSPAAPVVSAIPFPPSPSVTRNFEADEERLSQEEEALQRAADALERKRADAEIARRKAEEKARLKAESEAQVRLEIEAQIRAEEEARTRMAEEGARRQAEEEARVLAELDARKRAEEEARQRAEEEARFRHEAETLRKAAKDLARKRAETEAARKQAEEEARLREVEAFLQAEAQRKADEQATREAEQKRAEAARARKEAEERQRAEEARLRAEQETLMQVAAELAHRRSQLDEVWQQAEVEAQLLVEAEQRARTEQESRRREIERQRMEAEAQRLAEEEQLAEARRAEVEARLKEEGARLQAEHEARVEAEKEAQRLSEVIRQKAEEEARLRAEIEARLREQEAQLMAEQETRARVEEEEIRRAEELRQRVAVESRRQAEAEAELKEEEARRAEVQARLSEQEARLLAEQEARAQLEEDAKRLTEEFRLRTIEESRRRAEAEAQLREEEARHLAELEARERAEEEARQLAEENRAKQEEAVRRRRAQAEARLIEAEGKLQAEHEASLRAEAEAERIAEEIRQQAEEEARRGAEAEARLREEEARLQSAQEARAKAEVEALRLVQESESLAEDARIRAEAESRLKLNQEHLVSDDQDLTANSAAPLADEPSAPEYLPAEIAWSDSSADTRYQNGNPPFSQIEETQTAGEVSVDEIPAKGIDVVFAEKGIVQSEDDGGIPSEILTRLASSDPTERRSALADVVRVGGDDAFRCISRAFDDQSIEVRNAAASALFALQPDRAATFTRALREGSPERRRKIGQALAGSGLARDAIANLTGESREKTYDAFSLLFLMAKAGEVQPLMQAIEDYPNVEVRIAVVKLLALSGQPEIIPAFRRMAVRGSLPSEVRSAVMEAIYQIGSQARESSAA